MRRSTTLLIVAPLALLMGISNVGRLLADRGAAPPAVSADVPASAEPSGTALGSNGPADDEGPSSGRGNLPLAANKDLTLIAVGDVMLSRSVAKAIKDARDPGFPFARMRDWLRTGDVVFGNLETAVLPGRTILSGEMTFRSDPSAVAAMRDAGFTVVSLANNHSPNFGQKGLAETFRHLRELGLAYAGAGSDDAEAGAPAFIEKNGRTVAFLAYNDTDVVPSGYGAAPGRAGTAFMDVGRMQDAVRAARTKADLVVVSMHAGKEYVFVPNASQTAFARAAIEAGADLVLGHHPHVVQSMETYMSRPIIYSFGNFVFDQMWSDPTREGLAAKFVIGEGIRRIDLLPVVIDGYAQPRPSDGIRAERTLSRLLVPLDERVAVRWDPGAKAFAATRRMTLHLQAPPSGPVEVSADLDGDGAAETVAVAGEGAEGCAGGTMVVRRAGDGAEVFRGPDGCYAGLEVEPLDGSLWVIGDLVPERFRAGG